MVALGTDHYIVMIDPASFIDVIPFGSSQIDAAIIGEAHNIVITSSDLLKPEIIQQLQQGAGQHLESNGTLYIFSLSRKCAFLL